LNVFFAKIRACGDLKFVIRNSHIGDRKAALRLFIPLRCMNAQGPKSAPFSERSDGTSSAACSCFAGILMIPTLPNQQSPIEIENRQSKSKIANRNRQSPIEIENRQSNSPNQQSPIANRNRQSLP
jgi:hypothetical protein